MRTKCSAHMEFIDVTAIEDAAMSTDSNVSFGQLSLFKKKTDASAYGTLELNQFLLDGSRSIINEDVSDVAYMSDETSKGDCSFDYPPSITVSFTRQHTSAGLKFYFIAEYPAAVRITWYTLAGTKIECKEFYPDSLEYFCRHQVENYGKILIEFTRTLLPYRYIRLNYIKYGSDIDFDALNITKASLTEELDVTSATLSINECNMTIIDEDNEFDLQNNNGTWKSIQKQQPITVVENIDGRNVPCGTFYMSEWSSSDNEVTFILKDRIGVMDETNFYYGRIYVNEAAGNIIDDVMSSAGITDYTVDKDIRNIRLSGYLAIQTHRAALQQIVFACGAVADCSRGSTIRIYKPDRYVSHTIGIDRKFSTKVTLDEYVSSVTVTYSQYALNAEKDEIYNDKLPAGLTRIEFTAPHSPESIEVSAGTITEAKTNYMIIDMPGAGACVISGLGYTAVENKYKASVPLIQSGETENNKDYSGCTLVNAVRAKAIAEYILNYLQMRQIVNVEFINEGELVGNWCNLQDRNIKVFTSGITKQTINLAGGNISQATCRGYDTVVTDYYFAGTELYSGEVE